MLELVEEVVEVELVLGNLLCESSGFGFVKLFLRLLDKADDVAHSEDAVGHTFGVEDVERLHLFARSHELDGFVHHGPYAESRSAAGVTVEFGEYHAVVVKAVVEFLGGVHGVLSGHGIDDEKRFVGFDGSLHGSDFVHQRFVDGEASGGIDDDGVVALGLGFVEGGACNGYGVLLFEVHVDGYIYLFCQHAELFDGGGAVGVAGGKEGVALFLCLQEESKFSAQRGLSRTVESGHEDDSGTVLEFEVGGMPAHECGKFVVHNLHQQLRGFDGGEDVLSQRFLLDGVGEAFCHLVVDVGVEEGTADILQGFCHVDFGDAAFTFENLERAFKSFA